MTPTEPKLTPSSDRNWLDKARSRAWATSSDKLSDVPAWALVVGTFFGTGLSPFASGTVGSAAAALLYYLIPALREPLILGMAIAVVLVLGIAASNVIEKALNKHDPGIIVADEVLGQWIALFTIGYATDSVYLVLAFLFFRLFDILKLWPATIFENRTGGAGVMLDDAVAGIYANIAAHAATYAVRHLIL